MLVFAAMIIAPQSLSWQLLIADFHGDFTARLTAYREPHTLIY